MISRILPARKCFSALNRNGVLFPAQDQPGKFAMLSRPSDTGHTPSGIFSTAKAPTEILGAPPFCDGSHLRLAGDQSGRRTDPLETSEGWLLIYHGVLHLLQRLHLQLWRGTARSGAALEGKLPQRAVPAFSPLPYEQVGDVPNVAFPSSSGDGDSGRIAIYTGEPLQLSAWLSGISVRSLISSKRTLQRWISQTIRHIRPADGCINIRAVTAISRSIFFPSHTSTRESFPISSLRSKLRQFTPIQL